MSERCEIPRCRAEADLIYLGHGVCDRHWNQLNAEDAPPDALRMALGIEVTASTATEDVTMEPTTSKTPKKQEAAKTDAMAKAKKVAKAQEPKEPKLKKEKAPKEPQVVFAFRLTEAQRDAIHKAAGQGRATRFVLAAALAAASGDRPAFEELLALSKTNLK